MPRHGPNHAHIRRCAGPGLSIYVVRRLNADLKVILSTFFALKGTVSADAEATLLSRYLLAIYRVEAVALRVRAHLSDAYRFVARRGVEPRVLTPLLFSGVRAFHLHHRAYVVQRLPQLPPWRW